MEHIASQDGFIQNDRPLYDLIDVLQRWLFIIEGVVTIFVSLCSVFLLPNYPATTKWLTEEERAFAA